MKKKTFLKLTTCTLLIFISFSIGAQVSISLIGKLKITNLPIHDVWGYTDAVSGKKYALLCASTSGLRIIDLTTIANPIQVGSISGNGVQAIDVKTWKNYAYVVGESSAVSGKIIDLTNPANPIQVGTFPWAHNITISDSGYMYLSSPGVRIFNLNPNPIIPQLVYSDNSCTGHDISIVNNKLYDFSDNCGTRIFDISQPDTLVTLGTVPPSGIFHHSGWPSYNGNYLMICDELAAPSKNDITVWDISNIATPFMVDSFIDPNSFVHNAYIKNNYAFVSYYRAGFRVFDLTNPANITLAAEYDTDSLISGPGYGGNFGLFTNWGTDSILASDEGNGLYIFSVTGLTNSISDKNNYDNKISIFPNPSNKTATLTYSVDKAEPVIINIYNAVGQLLQSFDEGKKEAGQYSLFIPVTKYNSGIHYVNINNKHTTKFIINN